MGTQGHLVAVAAKKKQPQRRKKKGTDNDFPLPRFSIGQKGVNLSPTNTSVPRFLRWYLTSTVDVEKVSHSQKWLAKQTRLAKSPSRRGIFQAGNKAMTLVLGFHSLFFYFCFEYSYQERINIIHRENRMRTNKPST